MIERIRELSEDQIGSLKSLGQDTLTAISPPIASLVYGDGPDQLTALQRMGLDELGAISPQLADMLYGDAGNTDQGLGQPIGNFEKGLGRYPGQPPIILPPFPQPPGDDSGDDERGPGNEPPGDNETPEDYVSWWSFADACPTCLDNADDAPRPYGVPFSSGDVEPPAHDNCRCELVNGIRGACPIHGYRSEPRIFELSSRY
jgi:hypothetical protein